MQLVADVGGIPGKDCNGFCKYCYFRKVKDVKSFGCAYCLPNKVGCDRCSKGVSETQGEFKSPFQVISEVQNRFDKNKDGIVSEKEIDSFLKKNYNIIRYLLDL